jgi:hypothetical protein
MKFAMMTRQALEADVVAGATQAHAGIWSVGETGSNGRSLSRAASIIANLRQSR